MSGVSGYWQAGGASVLGAAHRRRDLPNQDAHIAEPEGCTGPELLISVADGHGGADYVRSDIGALLAVQALRTALDWFPETQDDLADLKTAIVATWRSLVCAHLEAHPMDADAGEPSLQAYGTTLVAVAATQRHLLLLQLGDGDLVLGYPDGGVVMPLREQQELPGEQTYSLCLAGAERFMRAQLIARNEQALWPEFALVATDGVSKSFVDQSAFLQAAREYRDIARSSESLSAVTRELPDWLRSVSDNGSGDDATLCLALWRLSDD